MIKTCLLKAKCSPWKLITLAPLVLGCAVVVFIIEVFTH